MKDNGCVKNINWEQGGQMHVTLDRESPLYKAVYIQSTSCKRINSQAQALDIGNPKMRNIRSVRNLNTQIEEGRNNLWVYAVKAFSKRCQKH